MKKIYSIMMVALAVIMLASCSSTPEFVNKKEAQDLANAYKADPEGFTNEQYGQVIDMYTHFYQTWIDIFNQCDGFQEVKDKFFEYGTSQDYMEQTTALFSLPIPNEMQMLPDMANLPSNWYVKLDDANKAKYAECVKLQDQFTQLSTNGTYDPELNLKDKVNEAVDAAKEATGEAVNAAKEAADEAMGAAKDAADAAKSAAGDAVDAAKSLVK